MQYVGMYTQQARNNFRSLLLLCLFPTILIGMVWVFFVVLSYLSNTDYYSGENFVDWNTVNYETLTILPWVVGGVSVWFIVAYLFNTSMVRRATGARPLERRENPRIYNIVENLCMEANMDMPKINVIDDPQLNAFASGIDKNSYTVTVTTGICNLLTDDELAGVIGHELTHIRNRDTRLLIISIIFVGIMSTLLAIVQRMIWHNMLWGGGNNRRNEKNGASTAVILAVALVITMLGYFFTIMTRFAISRKREYMADAGGAQLCGNPLALASALRKISGNPALANTERQDVAQLFIIHPQAFNEGFSGMVTNLFSTHPSTESRIRYLEQF